MNAKIKESKIKSKKDTQISTIVPIDPSKADLIPKVEICPRDEKGRFLKGFFFYSF